MKVPIPKRIALKISEEAVKNAREAMQGFGWSDKSLQSIQTAASDGTVGIRTSQKYIMYQEHGTKPFMMTWVNGRTIPLSCPQGDGPHFRRGGHVGEAGYVNIPHQGKVWRDQRWHNPGIKAKHFMRDALDQAIADNKPLIRQWAKGLLDPPR